MRSPCCLLRSADTHCSWLRDHAHSAEALKHSSSVAWTLQLPAEEVLNYTTFIKSGCRFDIRLIISPSRSISVGHMISAPHSHVIYVLDTHAVSEQVM